jgi:hypothetical protein
MGFGSFFGGIVLSILAVLLIFFGIAVLIGYFKSIATNLDAPFGIVLIIVAFVLLLFGWYSYKSGKPDGTVDVHNQ